MQVLEVLHLHLVYKRTFADNNTVGSGQRLCVPVWHKQVCPAAVGGMKRGRQLRENSEDKNKAKSEGPGRPAILSTTAAVCDKACADIHGLARLFVHDALQKARRHCQRRKRGEQKKTRK